MADHDDIDTFYSSEDAENLREDDLVWQPIKKAEAQRLAKQAHKEGGSLLSMCQGLPRLLSGRWHGECRKSSDSLALR